MAVGVLVTIGLGEHDFRKDRCHTEKGRYPKPEKGTGAARNDGSGGTSDVTGTDLSGNGGRESLKRTHTGLVGALTEERCAAEKDLKREAELSDLNETQTDRVEDTGTAQQGNKTENTPKYAVDVADKAV